ncbi:DUF3560 domain-containing protein [Nocardia wallacei]|uniref:DUF3560 domain-containing protein n=1 Tax=Nocardia wallacei TaxID=480035 RepID=UPI002454F6F0|nr:DUF3560 domain-containing protein [Nocardia wallacei]
MSHLTITHTAAEGTMLEGTERGDGTYEVMLSVKRTVGHWKWARSLQCWIILNSRDRQPKQWHIESAAKALRAAGYAVELSIDRTARTAADAEAARAERQEDRVAALEAKADRRGRQAQAADAAHQRAHDAVPPMGEPIKIGHHSEHRHRKSIERAWDALGRSVEAHKAADHAQQRAEAASRTTDHRYAPVTVANRIEKLEAEQRGDQRTLDGGKRGRPPYVFIDPPASGDYRERVQARMTQRADEIEYWKGVRAEQIANGETTGYSKADVSKGDWINYRGSWYKVVRVNAKSVSVDSLYVPGYTDTVVYHEIRGIKSAAEAAQVSA